MARHLFWHMRGALVDGAALPEAWLTHEDEAVLRAVAVAVGYKALVGRVDAEEAAGEYLHAAQYSFVASMLGREGRLSGEVWNDRSVVEDFTARLPTTSNVSCSYLDPRNCTGV